MKAHIKRRGPITADEASGLFAKYYPHKRIEVAAKERLAALLSSIPGNHEADIRADVALRGRRATISAFGGLLEGQRSVIGQLRDDSAVMEAEEGNGAVNFFESMLGRLRELDESFRAAKPALMWPVAYRQASRTQSVWHRAAFRIAMTLRSTLQIQSPSLDKRGPFVKFVAAALGLSLGRTFTASAVAAALRRPTWTDQIASPPLWGRLIKRKKS